MSDLDLKGRATGESFLAQKSVLVTGAGGFIGSHLTERLVREGAKVRALVRYNSRSQEGWIRTFPKQIRERVEVIYGDVTKLESVVDAARDAKVIFHLAAIISVPYSLVHPEEVANTNINGTLNILSAASKGNVERVVLTSTSEVYGTARYVPIDENHPLQAQSLYAASKIGADALGIAFHRSFGLPVSIVRPFNTYGPRQSARAIIPTIISQALVGDEVTLGSLAPTRDFTFVEDTVEGFIRIAGAPQTVGEPVNLGTGKDISIGHLVDEIASLMGREIKVRQDPLRQRPSTSEVERLCSDPSRAKMLMGWQANVSLREGLARTIEWISQNLHVYQPGRYLI